MGTRLRTARAAFFLLLILAAAASDQLLGVAAAFLIWLVLELKTP